MISSIMYVDFMFTSHYSHIKDHLTEIRKNNKI